MSEVSFVMAFFSGILYFFTPCVLPLIPSFLSFISGISFEDIESNNKNVRKKVVLNSLIFFLGFTFVFVSLGLGASAIGSYIIKFKLPVEKFAGIIIIVLGLYLIFQKRLKIFLSSKNFLSRIKPVGVLGIVLVGGAFAFSWTACATPILAAILVVASMEATLKKGLLLLLLFSLGLGIPFMLSAFSLSLFLGLFKRIKKALRFFEIIAGVVLIFFGFYIVTKNF